MDTLSSYLPSLSRLVAFEAVARRLGFTRAGKELNVTQAAVNGQGIALVRPIEALAPFSDAHYVILPAGGEMGR